MRVCSARVIAATTLIVLCGAGCGPTVADEFKKAQSLGTVAAWRHFLASQPDASSDQLRAAREALDDAAFEHMTLTDPSPSAYEAYMEEYPEGRHIRAALVALDDLAYERAAEAKRYDDYLQSHPRGRHAEEARRILDKVLFDQAVERGAHAIEGFLKDRPDTAYRADAWSALEKALVREAGDGGLILWRVNKAGRQVGVDSVVGWHAGRAFQLSALDLGGAASAGLAADSEGRMRLKAKVFARRIGPPPEEPVTAVLLLRVDDSHRVLTAPVRMKRSKRAQNLKLKFEGRAPGPEERSGGRAYVFLVEGSRLPRHRSNFRPVSNIASLPVTVLAASR